MTFKSLHAPASLPQGDTVRLQVDIGMKTSRIILILEGIGSSLLFLLLLLFLLFLDCYLVKCSTTVMFLDLINLRHAFFFPLHTVCS